MSLATVHQKANRRWRYISFSSINRLHRWNFPSRGKRRQLQQRSNEWRRRAKSHQRATKNWSEFR